MTTTTQSARRGKSAEPRRESLLADFAIVPITAQERRLAALAVCARVETKEEAHDILEALGLLDVAVLKGAA